jgi:hypothetical protein
MNTSHNVFNMDYYRTIIREAQHHGYKFVTLREFVDLKCPDQGYFILRHDLDRQPMSLKPIIETEREMGVNSTLFVRLAGADYNLLSYPCFRAVKHAHDVGTEIGLHTNPVEFAAINDTVPWNVLSAELKLLRSFFSDIDGVAPHRDVNYMYNTLPWLDENWSSMAQTLQLKYHAYEKKILETVTYVNEGFDPHLCWRSITPEQAMVTGKSIYMLTHPHWWFKDHAFEAP